MGEALEIQSKSLVSKPLKERKREAVLKAARESFLENGFAATSMDVVAARAGASKRTVYNHFASKEELFKSVIDEFHAWQFADARLPYNPQVEVRTQLLEIAQQEVEILCSPDYRAVYRLSLSELGMISELVKEKVSEEGADEHPFAGWVASASEAGVLVLNGDELAASHFIALLKGTFLWPVLIGYQEDMDKPQKDVAIESIVDMFLSRYKA